MSKVYLNNNLTTKAELLLSKGVSFCLYRFPNAPGYNLAVGKELLPVATDEFVIAPFIPSSTASTVRLAKVNWNSFTEAAFEQSISILPMQEIEWAALPAETSKDEYFERIENYLEEIRSGKISKAILSRVLHVSKSPDFDPFILFKTLSLSYPETFTSLFYIPGNGLWMCASPELLLKKKGQTYQTMALAGTQPKKTGSDYHWRTKELEEQQMVSKHIEEVFAKNNCAVISVNGPYSFETGKVAHLKTDYIFEGEENKLAPLIHELHPTPAIGGLPVKAALDCIKKYEGYSRNYYAGYLGETNESGLARFFINLRCMQIGEKEIAVFSGGGITADSDPSEEWEETVHKSLTLIEKLMQGRQQHVLK